VRPGTDAVCPRGDGVVYTHVDGAPHLFGARPTDDVHDSCVRVRRFVERHLGDGVWVPHRRAARAYAGVMLDERDVY
jgi:hypothetical protein